MLAAMVIGETRYPFVPKSRRKLRVGQFWSMPVFGRHFACGTILRLPGEVGSRQARILVVGIHKWLGKVRPTAEDIAGRRIVAQGVLHVDAIRKNGGEVEGFRRLSAEHRKAVVGLEGLPEWSAEGLERAVVKAVRDLR